MFPLAACAWAAVVKGVQVLLLHHEPADGLAILDRDDLDPEHAGQGPFEQLAYPLDGDLGVH